MLNEREPKTASELRLLIAEEMMRRGLPLRVDDIIITKGAAYGEWRAALGRRGKVTDLNRVSAVEHIVQRMAAQYRLVAPSL